MLKDKEKILECLMKYECCHELIDQIKNLSFHQQEADILKILKNYQRTHQDKLDEACKHIDCIDYLIYEIERKEDSI